jgi:pimeloyl-ACP methyl ester carboxylesterase
MQLNTSNGTVTFAGHPAANGIVVHEVPVVRDVGRFREKQGMKYVRAAVKTLCTVAPWLATELGFRIISTPPRSVERDWQVEARLRAKRSTVLSGTTNICVYEWGAGPTILMVHGLGARSTFMAKMIDPLVEAGYRVVSFDAPRHGETRSRYFDLVQFPAAINSVANYVGDIELLVAHSFGSAMALTAQRDWGIKVRQQVLISTFDNCNWFLDEFAKYLGLSKPVMRAMQKKMSDRYSGGFDWNRLSLVDMLAISKVRTLLVHDTMDAEIPFQHSVNLLAAGAHVSLHATHDFGHHKILGSVDVLAKIIDFAKLRA